MKKRKKNRHSYNNENRFLYENVLYRRQIILLYIKTHTDVDALGPLNELTYAMRWSNANLIACNLFAF